VGKYETLVLDPKTAKILSRNQYHDENIEFPVISDADCGLKYDVSYAVASENIRNVQNGVVRFEGGKSKVRYFETGEVNCEPLFV
jgi:carotenoid cleavage dioxygenase-like enzyme